MPSSLSLRIPLSASPEPLPAAARWGIGAAVLALEAALAWALLTHLPPERSDAASPEHAIVVDMIATATQASPQEHRSSPAPMQLPALRVLQAQSRHPSNPAVAAPVKPSVVTSERAESSASASKSSVAENTSPDITETVTQANDGASAAQPPTVSPPGSSAASAASNAASAIAAAPVPPAPKALAISAIEYLVPPQLEYPLAARRMREQGEARVRVLVDVHGLPQQLQLLKSSGSGRLDEAALKAACAARFKPYMENGIALPFWVVMPLVFELEK